MTERLIEGLGIGEARGLGGPLLGEQEPDAGGITVVYGEPAAPRVGVRDDQLGDVSCHAFSVAEEA
jgi:hypothetical protein